MQAILLMAGMSNTFWECTIATAVHVRNRAPSCANNYSSPHECLFNCTQPSSYLCIKHHIPNIFPHVPHLQSLRSFYHKALCPRGSPPTLPRAFQLFVVYYDQRRLVFNVGYSGHCQWSQDLNSGYGHIVHIHLSTPSLL